MSPTWSVTSEEIQFRVILLAHKDDESGRELVWDGYRLMDGDRNLLAERKDLNDKAV